MRTLKEVLGAINEADMQKEAEAEGVEYVEVDEGLLKQAEDYDNVGRILAHTVFEDMVKQAVEEEAAEAASEGAPPSDDDKKKRLMALMAKARGEAPAKKEEGDEEKDEEGDEKKASVKLAILDRMSQDPDYISALIAKHYPG